MVPITVIRLPYTMGNLFLLRSILGSKVKGLGPEGVGTGGECWTSPPPSRLAWGKCS